MYRRKKHLRLYTSIFYRKKDEGDYDDVGENGPALIKKGYYYSYREFQYVFYSHAKNGIEREEYIEPKIFKQLELSKSINRFQQIEELNRTEFRRALPHLVYFRDRRKKLPSSNTAKKRVKFIESYLNNSLDWFRANKLKEPGFRINGDLLSIYDLLTWGDSQPTLQRLFNQLQAKEKLEDELTLSEFESHFIVNGKPPISGVKASPINFKGKINELSYLISRLSGNFIKDSNFLILTSKNFLVESEEITAKQLDNGSLKSQKKIKDINNIIRAVKKNMR